MYLYNILAESRSAHRGERLRFIRDVFVGDRAESTEDFPRKNLVWLVYPSKFSNLPSVQDLQLRNVSVLSWNTLKLHTLWTSPKAPLPSTARCVMEVSSPVVQECFDVSTVESLRIDIRGVKGGLKGKGEERCVWKLRRARA
jgi:hypothetical protein